MIHPGLASVTFRELSPAQIVDLVGTAGLLGIEWGGDVHVPHGDLARACEVRKITEKAHLKIAAYGSYYHVGHEELVPFETVLATAKELGAPIIRVLLGKQGSANANQDYLQHVVKESYRISELAAAASIRIACEWHGSTLTDDVAMAVSLLKAVNHEDFRTYWQTPQGMPHSCCLKELEAVRSWLIGLHVFYWHVETRERLALADGRSEWRQYLARANDAGELFALMEFVPDDSPEAFLRDAATLKSWLSELNP